MSISKTSESELKKKIDDGSKSLEDYSLLGSIYFERGDYEKFLKLTEKSLRLSLTNEERAFVLTKKGDALDILGMNEETVSCLEESIRLQENEKETPSVLNIKGMNHYRLLPYSEGKEADIHASIAIENFVRLLDEYPGYEEYMVNSHLATLYCRIKDFDKSIAAYKKAVETSISNEDKVWCLGGIGFVYSEKGDFDKSEEAFKQALNIAENKKLYSRVYFDMGVMYFKSNNKQKAIDAFDSAISYKDYVPYLKDNKKYSAEIYWYLGTLAYECNYDFDKATEYLNNALEVIGKDHVDFCDTHLTLGHCYLAKENYDKAKEHYNIALSATLINDERKVMINKCLKEIETKGKGTGIGSFFSKIKKKKK